MPFELWHDLALEPRTIALLWMLAGPFVIASMVLRVRCPLAIRLAAVAGISARSSSLREHAARRRNYLISMRDSHSRDACIAMPAPTLHDRLPTRRAAVGTSARGSGRGGLHAMLS